MKKKGISLVALVVTIIVLIVLTGAVVATFMEGGIIDKAKEAVMKSDCSTLIEAYNIAYNTAKIDEVTGTGEKVNKIEILEKVVNELGLKGFEFDVPNHEVDYNGDNTEIEKWINNTFKFASLAELGYELYTVEGKLYMTLKRKDVVTDSDFVEVYGVAEEIKNALGEGYTLEGEFVDYKEDRDGDGIEDGGFVTTGTKILKDGEVYATIIVKGDVDGDYNVGSGDFSEIINMTADSPVEKLLAADVNNDGYVSQDDIYMIERYFADEYLPNLQEITKDKVPEVVGNIELYDWQTANKIGEVLENYSNFTITYKSGSGNSLTYDLLLSETMTYAEFESEIKEILEINKASVSESNKTKEIQVGDTIRVEIPYKLSNEEYCIVRSITFNVK